MCCVLCVVCGVWCVVCGVVVVDVVVVSSSSSSSSSTTTNNNINISTPSTQPLLLQAALCPQLPPRQLRLVAAMARHPAASAATGPSSCSQDVPHPPLYATRHSTTLSQPLHLTPPPRHANAHITPLHVAQHPLHTPHRSHPRRMPFLSRRTSPPLALARTLAAHP